MLGALMLDIAGKTLTEADAKLLTQPEVGGVILFARNIGTPAEIRALTDSIRAVRAELLIAVDQEGGRVRRLREGFSPIPAMGELGAFFERKPVAALTLAKDCAALMAAEVLAVGIDFSFAPVLDINGVSRVIGDRGFHGSPQVVAALAQAFMSGMNLSGMATTGKHFPGHGSCAPDSHVADAIDERSYADILAHDLQPFVQNFGQLNALMPAHVIYPQIDAAPAGFSKVWLQDILRDALGFDGAIFTDDLSMKAARAAGSIGARVKAAIDAGCDMVLVCNDRTSALEAVDALKEMPAPNQDRLNAMRGRIPVWQGSVAKTRQLDDNTAKHTLGWLDEMLAANAAFAKSGVKDNVDPTDYAV